MHSCFRALAVVFLVPLACAAQKPVFDVVSVRQSPPDTPARGFGLLNPFLDLAPKTGLFSANLRVSDYIGFAYHISDPSQLRPLFEQMPDWTRRESFDIEARSDTAPTRDQLRGMLRTVLEDRFKLKVHTEAHQETVYALVLERTGKIGPELRPHPADAPCLERPANVGGGIGSAPPPPYCGVDVYRHEGRFHVRMIEGSLTEAALALSGVASFMGGLESHPVQDHTGLSGRFDMDLEFVPQRPADAPPASDTEPTGLPFSDALKVQLGLKLTKQTATIDVFRVDSVERPSDN
jgi:uncharacterized protein (TIGR03435 family)